MAAWAIGNVLKVNDQAAWAEYQRLAGPTLGQYGGKVVAGGTKIEVGDGNWSPTFVIVIEFESLAKAKEWYNSPEYNPLVSRRTGSIEGGLIFLDGA